MISANVIKGVSELLQEQGFQLKPGETFGDRVAKSLDITDEQTEILLEALHDGAPLAEAAAKAGVAASEHRHDTLVAIAQAIGETLGRLRSKVS